MKSILVEVHGGNVTEVHNVPKGYQWEVIDWDNLLNTDFYTPGDAEAGWLALSDEAKDFIIDHYREDHAKIMARIDEDKQ